MNESHNQSGAEPGLNSPTSYSSVLSSLSYVLTFSIRKSGLGSFSVRRAITKDPFTF